MSMNYVPNRVAAGVPTGGQFAETVHHEAPVALGGAGDGSMRGRGVDFLHRTLRTNADKAARSRPGQPVRRRSQAKTRVAVAALVLAASVSLTACGTDKGQACQAAPDFGSTTVATASYTAPTASIGVPLRGGGHGSGHSSHSSGHSTFGKGFRWWPWAAHSDNDEQCTTDAPTSKT